MSTVFSAARQRVVDIARSWIGTPYHHGARLKGVGVDCAQLLVAVYAEAGLIEEIAVPPYSAQWNQNSGKEQYVEVLLRHAGEIPRTVDDETRPLPADVMVWKFGRTFSHGAIVADWPRVIHAPLRHPGMASVLEEDSEAAQWLRFDGTRPRPRKLFRLSRWA